MNSLKPGCAHSYAQPLPPPVAIVPSTNTYHLSLAWDATTNATGYAVIVRSNSAAWRVPAATNYATVSNLSFALDNYSFSCVATNDAGESPESAIAPLHWMTVCESDSINGPWTLLATNSFYPSTPSHLVRMSNWSAIGALRKD